MVLDRYEDQEIQARFQEQVQELLDRGIPIYYSETGDETGLIIKKHPDGRLEHVTFDWSTGKERILGPVLTKEEIERRLRRLEFGFESSKIEGLPLTEEEKNELRELVRAGKTADEIVSAIRKSMGLADDCKN